MSKFKTLLGRAAVAAAVLASLASVPAGATVVGGSIVTGGPGAVFVKLTVPLANPFGAPNSVGNDTFQSNNLFAFDETQNIVLAAPLVVDVVPAGPTTLVAGTTVASHYVFFDPLRTTSINGFVDFDADIVAIITSTGKLAASDFLVNTGVNYLNPSARGLEQGDAVTISGARQIQFVTTASTPGDYVRVLTAFSPRALPEPGSVVLVGLALAGASLMRRRTASK